MILDYLLKSDKVNKRDSSLKSVLKTVSWRIVGTLDTLIMSYLITGESKTAFSIASVEFFSKMVLYYLHERIWNKSSLS